MIGKRMCPKCDSENVEMVSTGQIGIWICTDCLHSGKDFPQNNINKMGEDYEDDFEENAEEEVEESEKKTKKKVKKKKVAKKKSKRRRK